MKCKTFYKLQALKKKTMIRYLTLLFLFISTSIIAQIKSPSEFLGYEIGTQFTRHAEVVNYFEHVAE